MSTLNVCLFGKLRIRRDDGQVLDEPACGKLQELLCYLLLNRRSPLPRESLATLLWGDNFTAQSKRCLRQALWQLKTKLKHQADHGNVVQVDSKWVRLNPAAGLWLDVAAFEQAFASVEGVEGGRLCSQEAQSLQNAVDLYQGDLLEGWYQDWCLCERQRLQDAYLVMLHKLMGYCEANGQYERGLSYGETILRYDHAQERTHRVMMRLSYLAGDRTGALRQYQRCVEALAKELEVEPAGSTKELYEQVRADQLAGPAPGPLQAPSLGTTTGRLAAVLDRLKKLLSAWPSLEQQMRSEVQAIEQALQGD